MLNKIVICFITLSLIFSLPLSVSADNFTVYNWVDNIFDIQVDGEYVICSVYPDYNELGNLNVKQRLYITGNTSEYWDYFKREIDPFSEVGLGDKLIEYMDNDLYPTIVDEIYILGSNLIDSKTLPVGTECYVTLDIKYSNSGSMSVIPYYISRDINGSVINYYGQGVHVFEANSDSTVSSTTFTITKGDTGSSSVPVYYDDFMLKLTDINPDYKINVRSYKFRVKITDLWLQELRTGQTNEILNEMLEGTDEQRSAALKYQNQANLQISDGDKLLNDLDFNKPDVDDIGANADIDNIVSQTDITSFTNVFSAIMNSPTVITLMTLTLTFALVAYVLFGKR